MIGRYTRPDMGNIWELENKFAIWKEIEVLACEAQAELGKPASPKKKHSGFAIMPISRSSASTRSRRSPITM